MSVNIWNYIVLLVLTLCLHGQAATIEVTNGSSIQNAINVMSGGDTLLVRVGTYNEKILIENLVGSASDVDDKMSSDAIASYSFLSKVIHNNSYNFVNLTRHSPPP
jgi:nitrous oxidase accessory protein NosD